MSNSSERLAVVDGDGRETLVFDGNRAAASLGGNGHAGDLRLASAAGLPTVRADGEGELTLGGNATTGTLRICDGSGRTSAQLQGSSIVCGGPGSDGDVVLKDHDGVVTFKLDGGSTNLDMGGHGHNADIRLKSAAGDITLHLDAEKGDLRVRGKAVSLGADHVFAQGHPLATLAELRTFITRERHLPGVPSASEMARDGVDLGALSIALLEKLEELTLHVLEVDARLARLEASRER